MAWGGRRIAFADLFGSVERISPDIKRTTSWTRKYAIGDLGAQYCNLDVAK